MKIFADKDALLKLGVIMPLEDADVIVGIRT